SRDHFDEGAGSTHEEAIDRVAETGMATGTGGRRISPNAPVRRDQIASFLTRALELAATPPPPRTLDEDTGVVAAVLSDLTDGGPVDTAVRLTTGPAGTYTRYVRDLIDATGEDINEFWGQASDATGAEPIGDHRHRLSGMRLDSARVDGAMDRVDDIIVLV